MWLGSWVSTSTSAATSNQVNYWALSDTSGTDTVGSDALTISGASATTDASLGNVLTFSGTNSGATAANNTSNNFTNTSAFSLAAWVNPTSLPNSSTQEIFATVGGNSPYTGIALNAQGSGLVFQLINSTSASNYLICTANNVFTAGTLTHVAVTYSGSQISSGVTMYANGAAVGFSCSGTLSASVQSGNTMNIGRASGGSNAFTGVIARAHIDNVADSASTIAGYYSGKTR